jgi:hypothetical protein
VAPVLNNISETNYHGSKMELLDWVGRYFTEGKNKVYEVAGYMGGGIVSINLLNIHPASGVTLGMEIALKWVITLVMAGITGLVTKMGADLWSDHIKHKIKIFKNGRKKDEQRRA